MATSLLRLASAVVAAAVLLPAAHCSKIWEESVLRYITRPDLSAPLLKIHQTIPELLSPGYLFVAAWNTDEVDVGPYIYDMQGHLVWSGASAVNSALIMNLHVCQFKSKPHLCFFEGRSKETWAQGRGIILDDQYQLAAKINANAADMHELELVDNGDSALVTTYTVEPYDGASLGLGQGFSWLLDSRFQEIDVASGRVKFEWSALDHIDPASSPKRPRAPAARTRLYPHDFFHLNSVARDKAGDYIISARHMNAIYKISHRSGDIMWQLGGIGSDFHLDFDMCGQHHVRIREESTQRMILSIFNNGCSKDGTLTVSASGLVVEVDFSAMTAHNLRTYKPDHELIVESQGSVEMLQNGNALVSWGKEGMVTEYTADGVMIFNASLGGGKAQTYRAYKADWHGRPGGKPNVFAFARTHDGPLALYSSWNGATEVSRWRFFGRNITDQPFEDLGSITGDGFETNFTCHRYAESVFVEALSRDGQSLGNSSIRRTFVPSAALAEYCTESLCPIRALNETLRAAHALEADGDESSDSGVVDHQQVFGLSSSQATSLGVLLLLSAFAAATWAGARWRSLSKDRSPDYTLLMK